MGGKQSFLLFFICCAAHYDIAGAEEILDVSDEFCMLQAPPRSSDVLRTKDNEDKEDASWLQREYNLVPHHKAGAEMTDEAAHKMANALSAELGSSAPRVEQNAFTMGYANESLMMQTPIPSCYAHEMRNPFEMVVSGYLYHMAGSEPWCFHDFGVFQTSMGLAGGCEPKIKDGRMSENCMPRMSYRTFVYAEGLMQLYSESLSGPLSDLLPDANLTDTYMGYLQRVDMDAGLAAEFLLASVVSLSRMNFSHGFVSDLVEAEPESCSLNMCYKDFYDECNSTWQHVLETWNVPEPHNTTMYAAALESCPGTSVQAQAHASSSHQEEQGLEHPPEHEMVNRLKELDQKYFNGALAALETRLGCPLSGKYAL